jgi:uncharacterized protein (TIGR00255 family)
MITSMTGFGSSRAEAPNLTVLVEVKSVNHRYVDIHVKIPGEFQSFENQIRQKITGTFRRGRFDIFVRIDHKRSSVRLDANESLIRAYLDLQDRLKKHFAVEGGLSMEMLSKIPGLISISDSDLTAEELSRIGTALDAALTEACRKLADMRATEGKALMKDIDSRLASITRHLATITAGAHGFVEHYRAQLLARIAELAPELVAASDHRLETEALLYAERSDVTEEITRLGSHLDQFSGLKKLNDEAGKRMDFILQEMNREVTTILSKTSGLNERGAAIGQAAIEIKVEIEKLREQVQNIE